MIKAKYFYSNIIFTTLLILLLLTCYSTHIQKNTTQISSTCQLQLECIGTSSSGFGRVRIPVRSARGPPGPTGEQGNPGPPGPRGETTKLQPIWVPRPVEYRISFYAALSKSIENKPLDKNCQLIFDSVMLNLGNGYDNTTGVFRVPVSGVYIFVVVISAQSYEKAGVRLLQNGKVVLLSWCESTFWATVTNQAIIQLKKNDQIWLECRDEAYRLHGHMYSSLSGYLLYPLDI
ncbi:hypothetical protein MN116_007011 [Schistosoma mekongi]|uniref:C1q domain-containing protein n=1 Tax=Schistosoma mekongi TaxID=38744 RepID=A0AAE1Z8B2_SCHME|nr:hypothetical protein MN116_007011 [Schistosoma mekongi]